MSILPTRKARILMGEAREHSWRERGKFQGVRVGNGDILATQADGQGLEIIKSMGSDSGDDFRADPALLVGFVGDNQMGGSPDPCDHCAEIEWQ